MTTSISLAQETYDWEEAKADIATFAEEAGFPFFICADDTAFACKDFETFLRECSEDEDGRVDPEEQASFFHSYEEWWQVYATEVESMEEALRAAYPWFHDGEQMPEV